MTEELVRAVQAALVRNLTEVHDAVMELADPLTEAEFWRKPLDPGNSFGHLVLHLTGNLRHFAGARLGNSGYVRDREREFTEPAVPTKAAALAGLAEAVAEFNRVVADQTAATLVGPHPDADKLGTVANGLTRLVAHFALHRGQMSYIARLVRAG